MGASFQLLLETVTRPMFSKTLFSAATVTSHLFSYALPKGMTGSGYAAETVCLPPAANDWMMKRILAIPVSRATEGA